MRYKCHLKLNRSNRLYLVKAYEKKLGLDGDSISKSGKGNLDKTKESGNTTQ